MIEVSNLSKVFVVRERPFSFKNKIQNLLNRSFHEVKEKVVLDDINFKLEKGKTLGLIGKNGSGKSTLIKILTSLYKKTTGNVLIDNFEVYDNPLIIRKKIGVLFGGDAGLYSRMTAYENIEYFGRLNGASDEDIKNNINKLATYFDMNEYLNRRVENFSRGMKQKVCFLRAVIHNPEIIILDEPSTGLDVESISKVAQFIKYNQQQNKTIIISSHNMNEIDNLCEKLLILRNGKQEYFGEKKDIIKNKNYEELYRLMGVEDEKHI